MSLKQHVSCELGFLDSHKPCELCSLLPKLAWVSGRRRALVDAAPSSLYVVLVQAWQAPKKKASLTVLLSGHSAGACE